MDIYKYKGKQAGNTIRKELRRQLNTGYAGRFVPAEFKNELIEAYAKDAELHVERSERIKVFNRKRRAEKHRQTIDMFNDDATS